MMSLPLFSMGDKSFVVFLSQRLQRNLKIIQQYIWHDPLVAIGRQNIRVTRQKNSHLFQLFAWLCHQSVHESPSWTLKLGKWGLVRTRTSRNVWHGIRPLPEGGLFKFVHVLGVLGLSTFSVPLCRNSFVCELAGGLTSTSSCIFKWEE